MTKKHKEMLYFISNQEMQIKQDIVFIYLIKIY